MEKDWDGSSCPLCDYGKLEAGLWTTGALICTVECRSCGAILPRYTEIPEVDRWV
jgi:hypothetical protein